MFAAILRKLAPAIALVCANALPVPHALAAASGGPIDADLARPAIAIPAASPATPAAAPQAAQVPAAPAATPVQPAAGDFPPSGLAARAPDESVASEAQAAPGAKPLATASIPASDEVSTWRKEELVGAAQGVFGKGATGLAEMIEDLLRKQGQPNGYIVGREGGGALFFGLRYGSGTLHHKVEGQRPVYWTGPSLGLDLGANAAKTFVLVYNLYDTEELYSRFGAGEGQAYLVGGFHVSYLRQGDKVLIPVRSGAGIRLGINAGYMKFSHSQKILPF